MSVAGKRGVQPLVECLRVRPWLCAALVCYLLWLATTCLGPLRLPLLDALGVPVPSWGVPVAAAAVACGLTAAFHRAANGLLERPSGPAVACVLLFAGLALSTAWLYGVFSAHWAPLLYVVGAALMGTGATGVLFAFLWHYQRLGVTFMLMHGSFALACAAAIQTLVVLVNIPWATAMLNLALPVVIAICLAKTEAHVAWESDAADTCIEDVRADGTDTGRSAYVKAWLTLAVTGLAFGFGLGLLHAWGDEFYPSRLAASLSLACAGVLLFAVAALLQSNFTRLVYQVGFPLMATGFLLMGLNKDLMSVGSVLLAVGFMFQYVSSLCLLVFLMRFGSMTPTFAGAIAMGGLYVGQLVGGCWGVDVALGVVAQDMSGIAMAADVMGYALLMVALFAVGGADREERWEGARPGALSPEVDGTSVRARELARARGLTPRETDVLVLAAHGRNKKAIARDLYVSEETAKAHLRSVYQKLGVHSQQDLIDAVVGTEP